VTRAQPSGGEDPRSVAAVAVAVLGAAEAGADLTADLTAEVTAEVTALPSEGRGAET
jgi:hypothetical protein